MQSFRRFGRRIAASLVAASLCLPAAQAQDVRIAAIVNDHVISIADLNARIDLVLKSSTIPDDPQTRRRVANQVMRQMIDETLEVQEAKKHNITATDEDIADAVRSLEHSNNLPAGGLDKYLKDHGIERSALVSQLGAQIVWGHAVRGRWAQTIGVSDEEINDKLKEIESHRGKPMSRVAEIFLSVENPSQEAEVRDLSQHLLEQIVHGAPFASVARQFSQSPTAAVGGDIGWVQPGDFDPEIEAVIEHLEPGHLSPPQRMTGGYYIFLLIDRKPATAPDSGVVMNLAQVVFPMAEDADAAAKAAVIARAKAAMDDVHSCGEMAKIGRDTSPELSGPIGEVKLTELPPDLKELLTNAEVAVPTGPIPVRGGMGVFMVCEREGGLQKLDRDNIAEQLKNQRLENLARRYLSDLRQVAYVDLRV